MSRPPKWRKIRSWPGAVFFKPRAIPLSRLEINVLTMGEYEALRLADVEGLDQAGAAERMGVSRATFARVLTAARQAVADALVNGKALEVEGGVVERLKGAEWPCPVHGGRRRRGRGCRCRGGRNSAGGGAGGRR